MDATINNRIKRILEATQLPPADFATAIGISRSNLTHLLSGRNQPSFSLLEKLLKAFPQIRTEWLVTGLGEMVRDDDNFAQTGNAISQPNPLPHTQFEIDFGDENNETAENSNSPIEITQKTSNNKSPLADLSNNMQQKLRLQCNTQRQMSKKIQKIVYFYTDNTFEEYFPR